MIFYPLNLNGLDLKLKRLQILLNDGLPYAEALKHVYGRLYQNKRENKECLEVNLDGKEYQEVFINDKEPFTAGFKFGTQIEYDTLELECNLICSGNLETLYSSTRKNDERFIIELTNVLRRQRYLRIDNIETDFDKIFAGLDLEGLKYRNMFPFCTVMFTGKMWVQKNCVINVLKY